MDEDPNQDPKPVQPADDEQIPPAVMVAGVLFVLALALSVVWLTHAWNDNALLHALSRKCALAHIGGC